MPLALRVLSAFKARPCVPPGQPSAWPACSGQLLWDGHMPPFLPSVSFPCLRS